MKLILPTHTLKSVLAGTKFVLGLMILALIFACTCLAGDAKTKVNTKTKNPVSKIMTIKKPNGEKVGEIRQKNGRQEAYAPNGRLLGTYDERLDETKLPNGHVESKGNSLSALIWKR